MFTNILTDELPTTISVKKCNFKINADYKTLLKISGLISPKTTAKQYDEIMQLFLVDKKYILPFEVEPIFNELIKFYSQADKLKYKSKKKRKAPIVDFLLDADIIYADFWREYHIDLEVDNIHWYKFLALFSGLSKDSRIGHIMYVRGADLTEIRKTSTEQAKQIAEEKAMYAIEKVNPITEILKAKLEECKKTGKFSEYTKLKEELQRG